MKKTQPITKKKALHRNILWIKKNGSLLNIYQIEKQIEVPQGTLKKFVDDKRGLAEQWHKPVIEWVKNFKK